MEILGYILALVVGVSLGLVGSGGSILTIPILVYIIGVNPANAISYSFFIVGITALFGGLKSILQKKVDFKTTLVFSVPSILVVYLTRSIILPRIPNVIFSFAEFELTKSVFLMLVFAVVMVAASISMIIPSRNKEMINLYPKVNYVFIFIQSSIIGLITGLVGAGAGFLIVPALIRYAQIPMKKAVGTSLIIIAINSSIGFFNSLDKTISMNWTLLILFTSLAIIGILIGFYLSEKIPVSKLKRGFGIFVLVVGIYILFKELLF